MNIDAHAHVWSLARGDYDWLTPELGVLHRDYAIAELLAGMAGASVAACVLVQAAPTLAETRYMLAIADAEPLVAGVVGWLDLRASDPLAAIAHPRFVGVRAMPENWAGTTLDDPAFDDAFEAVARAGLAFDALVEPGDLDGLLRRIEWTPALRVVIDHGANPVALGGDWARAMARLGAAGAWVKLSGWPTLPVFEHAPEQVAHGAAMLLEWFPGQVLWGSDWPVVTQACSYGDWHRASRSAVAGTDDADRARLFGGAAAEVYRLGARP